MTVVVTRRRDGHVLVLDDPVPEGADLGDQPVRVTPDLVCAVIDDDGDALGAFADARSALMSRDDAEPLLGAVAFGQWRARARYCERCGTPTTVREGGRALVCEEGHLTFPRIEPAVIMRVVDADDRILLARQPTWMTGRWSVLAGFVDPGESLEHAVRREVAEEVGVTVGDVAYIQSQPWPFPSSLMLAFHAQAETTDLVLQEDEIAEAEWFSRDDLDAAMAEGRVALPPPLSVAHKLVASWMGRGLLTWTAVRSGT